MEQKTNKLDENNAAAWVMYKNGLVKYCKSVAEAKLDATNRNEKARELGLPANYDVIIPTDSDGPTV